MLSINPLLCCLAISQIEYKSFEPVVFIPPTHKECFISFLLKFLVQKIKDSLVLFLEAWLKFSVIWPNSTKKLYNTIEAAAQYLNLLHAGVTQFPNGGMCFKTATSLAVQRQNFNT